MTQQQIAPVNYPSPINWYPLSGECVGRFAFTQVDAGFLQSLLPSGLELAPNKYAQQGRHPLLLMFDKVTLRTSANLERIASEYQRELTLNYNEFVATIPYVRFRVPGLVDGISYCFLPVLYLDDLLAVIGGRIFWEFNKRLSNFAIGRSNYDVKHMFTKAPLLSSTYTMDGDPVPGSSVPNFVEITPMLDLPVIEHGRLGYVSSIYKIEYQNLYIGPSSIELTNQSTEYLPPGSFAVPSIRQSVMGCFDMTYNWKLSFIKFHPNPN